MEKSKSRKGKRIGKEKVAPEKFIKRMNTVDKPKASQKKELGDLFRNLKEFVHRNK